MIVKKIHDHDPDHPEQLHDDHHNQGRRDPGSVGLYPSPASFEMAANI